MNLHIEGDRTRTDCDEGAFYAYVTLPGDDGGRTSDGLIHLAEEVSDVTRRR